MTNLISDSYSLSLHNKNSFHAILGYFRRKVSSGIFQIAYTLHCSCTEKRKNLFRFINLFHLLRHQKYHGIKLDKVRIKSERNIPFVHCSAASSTKDDFPKPSSHRFSLVFPRQTDIMRSQTQTALNIKRGGNKLEHEDSLSLTLLISFIVCI